MNHLTTAQGSPIGAKEEAQLAVFSQQSCQSLAGAEPKTLFVFLTQERRPLLTKNAAGAASALLSSAADVRARLAAASPS